MSRPLPATALVLAGGRSARFGADKLAYEVARRPLARFALDAVSLVCRDVVILAEPGNPELDPAWLAPTTSGWRVVRDDVPTRGPLVALRHGLQGARHARCVVVGADMPLLAPRLLELMLNALGDRRTAPRPLGVALRLAGEVQPLPLAIRRAAGPIVASVIAGGSRSLRDLLRALRLRVLEEDEWRPLDRAASTFFDVDGPDDLLRLRRELRQARQRGPRTRA
ncbi:MAG: NTP transferase domain-containing protein [Chloroflexota bacterium]